MHGSFLASPALAWRATTGLLLTMTAYTADAQVILDGTTGPDGALTGPDYQITDDLGTRAGDNLFHSFSDFSIDTGESAIFSGPDAIRNVISRVTGANPSDIDGTLRSTMPDADFYFINPNGVTFGPNATLDVQGSFHVSTADELRFEGGDVFSATNPDTSGFSVAEPRAFGFYDAPAGDILVDRSTLEVGEGETLSLVGGDITVDGGQIKAEAGRISLLALGGDGEADIATGEATAKARADITLNDQTLIDVSGDGAGGIKLAAGIIDLSNGSSIISHNSGAKDAQKQIEIEAERLQLGGNSRISADALDSGTGSNIRLTANRIVMLDSSLVGTSTILAKSGDISVDSDILLVDRMSNLSTASIGTQDAGDIVISSDAVFLDNQSSISSGSILGLGGSPGEININSDSLILSNGSLLASNNFGEGATGEITIKSREILITNLAGIFSISGSIDIATNRLTLSNRGNINASTSGAMPGGSINIETDLLEMDNKAAIASASISNSTGDAGDIVIKAKNFLIRNESFVSAGTNGDGNSGSIDISSDKIDISHGSFIDSTTFGTGDGGKINLKAGSIHLTSNAFIQSATAESGAGGGIILNAGTLIIRNGSISASGTRAQSGSVTLNVDESMKLVDSAILTDSISGGGGAIEIKVGNTLDLDRSSIITSVADDEGNAGNIDLTSTFLILDSSGVLARADGGRGGDIKITANPIIFSSDSLVNAEAGIAGIDGTVVTSSPEVDLSGGLIVLDNQFVDASRLLRESCESGGDLGGSTFVTSGKAPAIDPGDGLVPGFYSGAQVADEAMIAADAAIPPCP